MEKKKTRIERKRDRKNTSEEWSERLRSFVTDSSGNTMNQLHELSRKKNVKTRLRIDVETRQEKEEE